MFRIQKYTITREERRERYGNTVVIVKGTTPEHANMKAHQTADRGKLKFEEPPPENVSQYTTPPWWNSIKGSQMPKFEVTTDVFVNSWYRKFDEVEAETTKEAQLKVKAKYDEDLSGIDIDECRPMEAEINTIQA